jgi:hypothetical protein
MNLFMMPSRCVVICEVLNELFILSVGVRKL